MTWRLAKSLDVLRAQVNKQWPKRDKSSDGTIGDEAHASRTSDHNPWVKDGAVGVVTGMDITNDPIGGPNSRELAEKLVASRDLRIKYIISNGQICSGIGQDKPAWVWRRYSGSNAHRKHVHISVKPSKASYDSIKPWDIHPPAAPKPITQSKIAAGAAATGATEAADAGFQISTAIEKATQAKDVAQGLGLTDVLSHLAQNPRFWMAIVIVAVSVGIIYWRWRDHSNV